MTKFRIQPHGRLQEWVAHEKGYFKDEGLDYEFRFVAPSGGGRSQNTARSGAYEMYQEGQGSKGSEACDISSACHWAVNQASSAELGRMWGHAYSVAPGGVFVPPESTITCPEDLAGVAIAAGYHSGSHFAALQSLESSLSPDAIELEFIGRPMARLEAALAREVGAVSAWGVSQYVLEQHGFRRVADSTFMVGFLFPSHSDENDIKKFMSGLRRAQMDIDLTPERYKHYFLKELPEKFHDGVDVRLFGPGERIVFLPYTEKMYEETQAWMQSRQLFD